MFAVRRRKVVVNLLDGRALMGERRLSWPWQVVLSGAHLARQGQEPVAVDGRVIVPRHRIDFIQVVG
ncbi:hypothetical protein [Micromonospora sp. DT227]|uniref:hypothetical protein n=1 Tax=Micromonospora sp. DT227 TaxID=3393433 RepID=UPI003CED8D8F